MSNLQFLYGSKLAKKTDVAFQPGTLYLDVDTKELYFDNPSTTNTNKQHQKVIDADTLLYATSTTFPTSNVISGLLNTRDGKTFAPLTLIGNIYNADGSVFDAITKTEVNTELAERDTRLTTLETDVDTLEGYFSKVNTSGNIGTSTKPVYVSGNKITAITANKGSATKPVYFSSGTITESNATVGGTKQLIYMNAGTFTASNATEGSENVPVYLNGGVLTKITVLDTVHGGTGATAHTGNRLVWSSANGGVLKADAHYVSATKIAVNSATEPSYNLYVNGSSGFGGGHLYLTGANASSSTANTTQLIFGTANDVHLAVSSNTKALVLNPGVASTTNQIVLYLDQKSLFPSGLQSGNGLAVTNGASSFAHSVTMAEPLMFTNTNAEMQKITSTAGAMYYSSASTLYVTSGSGSSIIFCPQGSEQARFNTSGKLEIKSGGAKKATIEGPNTTDGTFKFPNTGGTFVTHATRGTAVGSEYIPVYVAANGRATAISYVGVGAGGTGVTSHTANRLVWSTSASAIQGGYHYANTTKVAINSTTEPTENFYVNGTAKVSGNASIVGTVTIGNGCTLTYDSTQKSLKFVFI